MKSSCSSCKLSSLHYSDGEKTDIKPRLVGNQVKLLCFRCHAAGKLKELQERKVFVEGEIKRLSSPPPSVPEKLDEGDEVYLRGLGVKW